MERLFKFISSHDQKVKLKVFGVLKNMGLKCLGVEEDKMEDVMNIPCKELGNSKMFNQS